MGMFDELVCKFPLPSGYEFMQRRKLQTKSLDCSGYDYEISEDGQLLQTSTYEDIPDDEREHMKPNILGIKPFARRVDIRESIDIHGDIRFYADGEYGKEYNLIVFVARFTEGKLSRIWVAVDANETRRAASEPSVFKASEHKANNQGG